MMARTNDRPTVKYQMRNDQVLIKKVRVENVRGLFMPEASMEGVQFVVQEVGPQVKDLQKGDVVFVKGTPGKDVGLLPNDSSLLVCPQENVLLVMQPVLEGEE